MYLRSLIRFIFPVILTMLISLAQGANTDKSGNEGTKIPMFYEFDELVIKVKIQEPEVMFILENPEITVEPFDKDMNFTEKIDDPLIDDNLF